MRVRITLAVSRVSEGKGQMSRMCRCAYCSLITVYCILMMVAHGRCVELEFWGVCWEWGSFVVLDAGRLDVMWKCFNVSMCELNILMDTL